MLLVLALLAAGGASATSSGPLPGLSGVPAGGGLAAEMDCTSCHQSYPLNPDDRGGVELRGLPERYQPGERYAVTFAIRHPDAALLRWGFQLTAVTTSAFLGAGGFAITDPENTQRVVGGEAGREYVEHTVPGTAPGRAGGTPWRFEWVAPAADVGDVAFFGGGVAANVDGSNQGDRVFNPTPEPLAIVRGPASAEEQP